MVHDAVELEHVFTLPHRLFILRWEAYRISRLLKRLIALQDTGYLLSSIETSSAKLRHLIVYCQAHAYLLLCART